MARPILTAPAVFVFFHMSYVLILCTQGFSHLDHFLPLFCSRHQPNHRPARTAPLLPLSDATPVLGFCLENLLLQLLEPNGSKFAGSCAASKQFKDGISMSDLWVIYELSMSYLQVTKFFVLGEVWCSVIRLLLTSVEPCEGDQKITLRSIVTSTACRSLDWEGDKPFIQQKVSIWGFP